MTLHNTKQPNLQKNRSFRVGIIGGGVAGSTIAIRLAALGVQTFLFESNASLISGPPMCHLHAGGNLYREIPDADGVELLKQSIDTLRLYPHSIDARPTVITVPTRDDGDPKDLLPRLDLLTRVYQEMIQHSAENKVLGEPEDYYKLYSKAELASLAQRETKPSSEAYEVDDWVANAAKQIDLDKIKYPVIAVREYGWNIFRLAASAQEALRFYPNAKVLLNTQVTDVIKLPIVNHNTDDTKETEKLTGWRIEFESTEAKLQSNNLNSDGQKSRENKKDTLDVDYLINACGFRTGIIDNMLNVPVKRMVEFKASYVTHWDFAISNNGNNSGSIKDKTENTTSTSTLESDRNTAKSSGLKLPEIIFHGTRGTPHGMVQLTPYPNGYYQIHSMNNEVTLFDDGLIASESDNAQPQLNTTYIDYIDKGWNADVLNRRSQKAIEQVSEFVPRFATARPTQNALYGGQQIPGDNDTLRVADVSLYPDKRYARAENVKASSALMAADDVVAELQKQELLNISPAQEKQRKHHEWQHSAQINKGTIDRRSKALANERKFPLAMSGVVVPYE